MRGNRNNLVVGTILLYLCLLWNPCPAAVIATDPAGDAGGPTIPNLDLLQLDAAVQDGYLIITLTINGDVGATDWGKYIVSIDADQVAGSGGMSQFPNADPPTNDANPWTRNIAIANQQHLAEYFIGSWVDGGGGVQLWRFTGTGSPQWQMTGGIGMAVTPGSVSTITYTILLSDLGASYPATLCMEAYSSGSYSYDTANDTVNNPSDDWVWDGQNWQAQATVQNSSCFELPGPKWSQPPHGPEEGFDAASDLWWNEIKWEQEPDPNLSGLHCHDWGEETYPPGHWAHLWITLADDWYCGGGAVTDLHWWGFYETIGSGIAHFHLSIHASTPGPQGWYVPAAAPLWQTDVPFTEVRETDTGLVGPSGPIYSYHIDLPEPFQQEEGNFYWLDITAMSVDWQYAPAIWRWAEANRSGLLLGHAPAAESNTGGPWNSVTWGGEAFSDMAFVVTSRDLLASAEPNKVVADDFVSDGRPIDGVRWWGSYLDQQYAPEALHCYTEEETSSGELNTSISLASLVLAQSFSPRHDFTLCKVSLHIYAPATCSATLYVQDGPTEDATVYTQATTTVASGAWHEFDVPDYPLLQDQLYYIRVSVTGANACWCGKNNPPPYPRGNSFVNGEPWNLDFFFVTYADGPNAGPHLMDGWFISFHHDQTLNPGCPPDFLLGDPHPTVLGVYFAPLNAVQITPLTWFDCLGHQAYEYVVDLSQCCLLCSQVDPRPQADPPDPARPGEFVETRGLYYWLDIQAVTGVTWQPQACSYGDRILTGHLPSQYTTDGHFWGCTRAPARPPPAARDMPPAPAGSPTSVRTRPIAGTTADGT